MYFCPECNYIFDITKMGSIKDSTESITLEEAITKIKNKETLNEYKIIDNIKNIEENIKFKKLNNKLKDKILQLVNSQASNIIFNCLNCDNKSEINKTISLYHLDLSKDTDNILSHSDCKILANDPILPRKKDYTCKNNNCITHKNSNSKEAVFLKDKLTYKLKYICCVCYTNWGLN